ncbi:hypothetical protein [Sphingomonas sp.]|uniref:hypothetical protein n=1 Tax=Sphingomonas sp. TaxID=28214 RepID=UPI0025EBEB91|nr:hypothetical protein [Sphingomonas sp.]
MDVTKLGPSHLEQTDEDRDRFGYLAIVSVCASTLGSILASAVLFYFYLPDDGYAKSEELIAVLWLFGTQFAIVVSLFLGVPALLVFGKFATRRPLSGTIAFGFFGLLGAFIVPYTRDSGMQNACLVFGACAGGMHVVVYNLARGVRWIVNQI